MDKRTEHRTHKRWIAALSAKLPDGVPAVEPRVRCGKCGVAVDRPCDPIHSVNSPRCPLPAVTVDPPWPATFGDVAADGTPIHRADEGGAGYLFQCEACAWFVPLDGRSRLGMDWGACSNPLSEYDGRVVFEHYTCRFFQSDWLRRLARASEAKG